jgi:hypothetical protein
LWEPVPGTGPGARDWREVGQLKGHSGPVTSVAVSADGARIVTGSWDNTARLWEPGSGAGPSARDWREVGQLKGHTRWVTSVAVSPDGARIVTGSDDYTARVWDARTFAELGRLEGHGGAVTSVAVTPDAGRIVTGSFDRTARVWELFPFGQALVADALKAAPRCLTPGQRQRYHLSSTPPPWCETTQKWPFDRLTIAESHLGARRYSQAIAAYEKAIVFDPGSRDRVGPRLAQAHDGIAWDAFLEVALRGKPVESLTAVIGHADKAVMLSPENRSILDTRGHIRLAFDRADEALADFDKAIALGISFIGTWYGRGRAHDLKGNRDAAIADYRKALASDAGDDDWHKHAQTQARARLEALGVAAEARGAERK